MWGLLSIPNLFRLPESSFLSDLLCLSPLETVNAYSNMISRLTTGLDPDLRDLVFESASGAAPLAAEMHPKILLLFEQFLWGADRIVAVVTMKGYSPSVEDAGLTPHGKMWEVVMDMMVAYCESKTPVKEAENLSDEAVLTLHSTGRMASLLMQLPTTALPQNHLDRLCRLLGLVSVILHHHLEGPEPRKAQKVRLSPRCTDFKPYNR